jgi:hypothetical protein
MEMMGETDTSDSTVMDSWPQRSFQQGYRQPAGSFPTAIPHSQTQLMPGLVQHQQLTFQHWQSFATASAPSNYSVSKPDYQVPPSNDNQFNPLPLSYANAMTHTFQIPNLQVQSFQDEMESLMMATDSPTPNELPAHAIWNNDTTTVADYAGVEFVENRWQPSTSPIDCKINPNEMSMMENGAMAFDFVDTKVQPRKSMSSHFFPSSFASDGAQPHPARYPLHSFGSYSERSDMTSPFSPMSPAEVNFGSQLENVQIRRNSDDQLLFQGSPQRGYDESHTAGWTGDAYPQSEWLVHDANKSFNTQLRTTQYTQPNLVFPSEPPPILHSQHDFSSLTSPDPVETEQDFGSPDPEDNVPRLDRHRKGKSQSLAAVQSRDSRDDLLVELRRRGLPYREIKTQGGYTEAESTLRGRFRTLTKEKSDRVRKPQWQHEDVSSSHINSSSGPD